MQSSLEPILNLILWHLLVTQINVPAHRHHNLIFDYQTVYCHNPFATSTTFSRTYL